MIGAPATLRQEPSGLELRPLLEILACLAVATLGVFATLAIADSGLQNDWQLALLAVPLGAGALGFAVLATSVRRRGRAAKRA